MKSSTKALIALHFLLMIYSMGGIFSKKAAGVPFLSVRFCLYYAGIIFLLGIYAIFWQQIIKQLPLTTAFANKAVTVIWGMIWGMLFFAEKPTPGKLFGIALVVVGIALFAFADKEQENEPSSDAGQSRDALSKEDQNE